ncbi:cathepsin d [Plakobranchus ocellatus]|uniref:Cathepsin d n=1 Tax=Plakobranchus ocellatus TaxID=259542 RepID=A0AAV3YRG0_9GAST|nr:cathepsin d [Plakobranchus ocellatus]
MAKNMQNFRGKFNKTLFIVTDQYKRYNHILSSTQATNYKRFDVLYDSGQVTGYFSEDRLTIEGLTIKNQSFGEALFEPDLFKDTTNDGVLGLGFSNIDVEEEPSVFDNMVSQGLLEAPVFSIYLNRYGFRGPDSVLTLGGTNPYYCEEEFRFVDLTVPHRWQFKIDRIDPISARNGVLSLEGKPMCPLFALYAQSTEECCFTYQNFTVILELATPGAVEMLRLIGFSCCMEASKGVYTRLDQFRQDIGSFRPTPNDEMGIVDMVEEKESNF